MKYYCDGAGRHLICIPYTVDHLHLMAQDLGIKRCWYHGGPYPHYDIPKRRILEISAKCQVVTGRQLLQLMKALRR